MQDPTLRLTLEARSAGQAEELGRDLRAALQEQPEIQAVVPAPLPPTPGEKGLEVDWNTLLLTLAASGGVLTTLITAIQAWAETRQQVSVTLTLGDDTLTIDGRGPYSAAQQAAIDRFLARHKGYVLPHE